MPEIDVLLALGVCNLQRALCRRLNQEGGKGCPSWTEFSILKALDKEPGINIQSLAAQTSLSSGSATYALDRLEADGFISRIRASKDSRVSMIYLTGKGEIAISELQKKLSAVSSAVFEGIIEERKTEILKGLESALSNATAD